MAFGLSIPSIAGGQDDGFGLSPDMLAQVRQMMAQAPSSSPAPSSTPAQPAAPAPLGLAGASSGQASVSLPEISVTTPRPQAGSGPAQTATPSTGGPMTDQQALIASAQRLGLSPVEWGGIIHYESGADPSRWGGSGGRHVGLIQFGPNEQKQFGVTGRESFQDQLGKAEAFLASRGYKPGMGVMNAYSTINAGSPGRFNASDAGNGGMPGTVADKVNSQFAPHYAWANKFLGGGMQLPNSAGGSSAPAAFGLSGVTQARGAGTSLPFGGVDTGSPGTAGSGTPGATAAAAPDAAGGGDPSQGGAGGKSGQKQGGASPMQFRTVRPRPFGFFQPMQFAGQTPTRQG
ncbi:MAG: hypothetical protein INR70_02160 [Parafilimonas terrae]|nr:hypothetical protein [Parafilimonas terrae]